MKQFKSVLKFEYLNYVRSKTFVGVTIFFLFLILVASFFPQIKGGIDSIFGSDSSEATEEISPAAFYDESGLYSADMLSTYAPEYDWTALDNLDDANGLIDSGTYDFIVHIDGLNVDIYESGSSSMYSDASYVIADVVKTVCQSEFLADSGLSGEDISAVLLAEPVVQTISIGKDSSQNFWLSYVVLFILYFALVYYGASIGTSVVTEKTSKAMELLVTSARPMSLMFGKVFGVGLAGLTQLGIIIVVTIASLSINMDSWIESYPIVGVILQSSLTIDILIYAIVFFLLGFFSYAFIYAALASTVSRAEDAGGVTAIPTMLIVLSFFVAMTGLATPEAFYLQVLSYIPFLSPMVMLTRVCLLDIPTVQILICIAVNVVYILFFGFISSKIYRVGIMLYGNKPKLRDIFSYIKS